MDLITGAKFSTGNQYFSRKYIQTGSQVRPAFHLIFNVTRITFQALKKPEDECDDSCPPSAEIRMQGGIAPLFSKWSLPEEYFNTN